MPSSFAWVDFTEEDRQKMMNVVHLFREQETRDELGIGTIRDAFADFFFPGTTTIQTRARYMLFVPWIYLELERKKIPSSKIADEARNKEIHLIEAILKSGQTDGLIGIDARSSLQRLPSNIYWAGLGVWGIRFFPGTQNQYHQYLDSYYRRKEIHTLSNDDDSFKPLIQTNWHPGIPQLPDNLFEYTELILTREEARYLRDQIFIHCPNSLLAHLIKYNHICKVQAIWEHPIVPNLPDTLQKVITHARNFSETIHGAALIYNLLLSKAIKNEEWVDYYQERIDQWIKTLESRRRELSEWYREWNKFWLIDPFINARIPFLSRSFVNQWMEFIFNRKNLYEIVSERNIIDLITNRERKLKGNRARLFNPRTLELWRGASGDRALDYRWKTIEIIVTDILKGLRKKQENA